MKILDGRIHSLEVLLHHGFTAFAVGLFDGMFDLFNGLLHAAGRR